MIREPFCAPTQRKGKNCRSNAKSISKSSQGSESCVERVMLKLGSAHYGSCRKPILKHYLDKSQPSDILWSTVPPNLFWAHPLLSWDNWLNISSQEKLWWNVGKKNKDWGTKYFQLAWNANWLCRELLTCPVHWHRHRASCSLSKAPSPEVAMGLKRQDQSFDNNRKVRRKCSSSQHCGCGLLG